MGTDTQPYINSGFDFDTYRGFDDHNLAEFPIFCATQISNRLQQTLITEHTVDHKMIPGAKITRRQEIVASQKYGLPYDMDGDVLLALMSLVLSGKPDSSDIALRVYFNRRELLEFMKWPLTGKYYRRLNEALHRWVATSFHYYNWWNPKTETYGERAFNVLNGFTGYNTAFDCEDPEAAFYVEFTPQFIKSFAGGWIKTLDLETYYSLKIPTAKLLFRFLDKRGRDGKNRHFDLRELVTQHLGLKGVDSAGKPLPPSRLRTSIAKAIKELEGIGFLETAMPSVRFGPVWNGNQKVTLKRGDVVKKLDVVLEHPLAQEMLEMEVWPDVVKSILANPEYSDEFIRERIEYVWWKVRTEGEETPRSLPKYFMKCIENPQPLPSHFETRQQREQREQKAKADGLAKAKKQKEEQDRLNAEAAAQAERAKAKNEAIQKHRLELTEIERHAFDKMVMEKVPSIFRKSAREYLSGEETFSGEGAYNLAALEVLEQSK